MKDPRHLVLSEEDAAWEKEFFSLFQAVHFAGSLSADGHRALQIVDSHDREITTLFV